MRWGSKGLPKEIDMLNNLKVVFTVSDHWGEPSHCFWAFGRNAYVWIYSLYLISVVFSSYKSRLFLPNPQTICSLFSICSFCSLPTSLSLFLFLKTLCLSLAFPKGPGKQRPEQRKDLPHLPDSESGQDGTERDKQQEMDSRAETSIRSGGYMRNINAVYILVESAF